MLNESQKKLIITFYSKLFWQQLEDSISLGHSLLIEDVDETVNRILDQILKKNDHQFGPNLRICIFIFYNRNNFILINIFRLKLAIMMSLVFLKNKIKIQ